LIVFISTLYSFIVFNVMNCWVHFDSFWLFRLRITLSAAHTAADVEALAITVAPWICSPNCVVKSNELSISSASRLGSTQNPKYCEDQAGVVVGQGSLSLPLHPLGNRSKLWDCLLYSIILIFHVPHALHIEEIVLYQDGHHHQVHLDMHSTFKGNVQVERLSWIWFMAYLDWGKSRGFLNVICKIWNCFTFFLNSRPSKLSINF